MPFILFVRMITIFGTDNPPTPRILSNHCRDISVRNAGVSAWRASDWQMNKPAPNCGERKRYTFRVGRKRIKTGRSVIKKFVIFCCGVHFFLLRVHAQSQYMHTRMYVMWCTCVWMCVTRVCLHIYRYIGTHIDRSKIAHASAHTSIYMHRNI